MFSLAFLGGCAGFAESAYPSGSIDPHIVRVDSGGVWAVDDQRGTLRVVVKSACGRDTCSVRSDVEWIAEPTEPAGDAEPHVHAAAPIDLPAGARVSDVEFSPAGEWNGFIEIEVGEPEDRQAWCVDVTHVGMATAVAERCAHGTATASAEPATP